METGWVCPKCGISVAPHVKFCKCDSELRKAESENLFRLRLIKAVDAFRSNEGRLSRAANSAGCSNKTLIQRVHQAHSLEICDVTDTELECLDYELVYARKRMRKSVVAWQIYQRLHTYAAVATEMKIPYQSAIKLIKEASGYDLQRLERDGFWLRSKRFPFTFNDVTRMRSVLSRIAIVNK